MHFSSTFTDDSQNKRMWNGRLDVQRLIIKRLQLLVVLLRGVHLDFKRVNLEQLRAFLQIIFAILRSATRVKLLQNPGQFPVFTTVKIQFAQLCHRLEPQSLIFGITKSI